MVRYVITPVCVQRLGQFVRFEPVVTGEEGGKLLSTGPGPGDPVQLDAVARR
jgi:hypothetical protein